MLEHDDILDAQERKKPSPPLWATIAIVFFSILGLSLLSYIGVIVDALENFDGSPPVVSGGLKSLLLFGGPGILATLISLIRKERWVLVKRLAALFSGLVLSILLLIFLLIALDI
ncbi:MAG: hypothetical protein AB8H12_01925 [Lewinella sp.]